MNAKLTPEERVVLFFALLGLCGGVALRLTIQSTLIPSIFLAIGIASLVYGFLGGIGGAAFAIGVLKLTGSAAALIGVTWLLNHYLFVESEYESLRKAFAVPFQQAFEWQWAGEGWLGHVIVEKGGVAKIDMLKFVTCAGQQRPVQFLKQTRPGKAALLDDGRLSIELNVQRIEYDECTPKRLGQEMTMIGALNKTSAYAGKIEYRTEGSSESGDMVLVNYHSTQEPYSTPVKFTEPTENTTR